MVFESRSPILEAMIDAIPLPFGLRALRGDDAIHVVDNRAAAQLFGRLPDETRGRTARELGMSAAHLRWYVELLTRAREQRQTVRMPTRYEMPDGSIRDLICHTTLLPTDDSIFACFIEDATDLHRLETVIAHAERLTSVGTMTAALVHDMAGPAMASTLLLRQSLDLVVGAERGSPLPLDRLHADLEGAQEGIGQLIDILRSIAAYTRPTREPSVAACDLNAVVDSALRMARAELAASVEVSFERGEVPPVRGSAVQLGQVVLNLVANAARAAASFRPVGEGRVLIRTGAAESGQILLEVLDNGPGLPADRSRLFEAFSTDHEAEGGTGLGLFISRRIVEGFGGSIELSDSLDTAQGGALAAVTLLPAASAAAR
jgi:PAS domain S-box-containing protein